MSSTLKQAILSLKSRIADAYTAIVAKGGTLPATQDSAGLPAAIASIPSGGGSEYDMVLNGSFYNPRFDGNKFTSVKINIGTGWNTFYRTFNGCLSMNTLVLPSEFTSVVSMESFCSGCTSLTSDIDLYIPVCTNFSDAFRNTRIRKLKLNAPSATTLLQITYSCYNLTEYDVYAPNVTNISHLFDGDSNLRTIKLYSLSNVTNIYRAFLVTGIENVYVDALPNISLTDWGLNFNNGLTHDSLIRILNALPTTTNGYTCPLGSTNLAKLTADEKAIATAKGWTLT